MIPARALRCHRTYTPQIQAATSAWRTAAGCAAYRGSGPTSSGTSTSSAARWSGGKIPPSGSGPNSSSNSGRFRSSNSGRLNTGRRGLTLPGVAPMASSAAAAATAPPVEPSAPDPTPAALWDEIVTVYDRAQATGACSKTDTQVEILRDSSLGVDFVLRVAAALKAKPQGPGPAETTATKATKAPPPAWRNPFSPPEPELFVRHLGPDHSLVLNKFNVVQHHVLVITREFRSQAEPLYGSDLAVTLDVLKAMPSGGVAFYNCGPNSGRSQPHKHLQAVPLPFAQGQPDAAPVQPLIDAAAAAAAAQPLQPLELRKLPYRCYAALLPERPTAEQLESAFNALLQLCHPGYSHVPSPLLRDGPPRDAATAAAVASGSVSYNVLLTRSWMMLVPRGAERCGPLALNSLAFAGTMLVRSEDELEFVRQTGPSEILARVGEPW